MGEIAHTMNSGERHRRELMGIINRKKIYGKTQRHLPDDLPHSRSTRHPKRRLGETLSSHSKKLGPSRQTQPRALSYGFHVPTFSPGIRKLEVTNGDFKLGRNSKSMSIRLYRTRSRDAVERAPKSAGNPGEHCHHAGVRENPSIGLAESRDSPETIESRRAG